MATATQVGGLKVELDVLSKKFRSAEEFRAEAVFTNTSDKDIRLNALFIEYAPLMLKVRHADGKPVNAGSPPFPPEDDGVKGRVVLKPGDSKKFSYRGVDLFGVALPKGGYQVRFRYENAVTEHGDWVGVLETDWVDFAIDPEAEAD